MQPWKSRLKKKLESLGKDSPRISIVGIGQELRGDDIAGVLAVRTLLKADLPERIQVMDSGPIPETCSGPIKRFEPELIIFLDAAEMGEEPGVIQWLDAGQISGISVSSHTIPLKVLAGYLTEETGADVVFLGIQIDQIEFGTEAHPAVQENVAILVNELIELVI
ncbi:MAG: hydrogenase maturation protease [Anaerolineales bacterium]|nr:hydrogenase maturation protease [Anaerolineales bacterium]